MERKERLKQLFDDIDEDKKAVIEPLLDEVLFIESQLVRLRKMPMIRVDKNNPMKQQATPASKMYKEYMQSYINAIKVLQVTLARAGETGESPLMKALKEFDNG